MALDPLTSLGLASSLVQFVDFSCKLFQGTRSIYKSATGSSEENACLHLIVADVQRLSKGIEASERHPEDLRRLAIEIKRLSDELLGALEELRLKDKKTKWKSFLLAMKEVWNKEKIAGMSERLSRLQAQLNTHIQLQIRDEVTRLSKGLAEIELNDRKFELRRHSEISSMRANQATIRDVWSKETVGLTTTSAIQTQAPAALPSENVGQGQQSHWVCSIQEPLEKLMKDMKEMEKDQELLLSLWFDSISIRQETLPRAHLDTFSWIFTGLTPDHVHPIRFVEWLRGSHSIYWIQGKAGSGKSTLMKFLGQHPETLQNLGFWAGRQDLIMARFYFWNSGSSLQKSQMGLLRSLLFEILRQCPKLLAQVRGQLSSWTKDSLMWGGDKPVTWQYEELLRVYQFVVEQNTDSKFCFFIDGLDEYKIERDKDHRHLVKTLKLLASSPSIKLCLSSRPWTVFSDAFGTSSDWMIKLEDLTSQDIFRYVSDKLQEHDQYDKLVQADENYTKLVEEVVRKAQGVFLWVFLVVRDLLEGLTYNDTLRTMYLRLSQFPEDLGSYFQRMIDSIPKFYRRETAQTFRIALAKEEPSLLVTYAFFDDLTENPMLRLEGSRACAPTPSELAAVIQGKHDTMRRRLDGRCKGLIEVVTFISVDNPIQRFRVDFLHRTVRDYLQGSEEILEFIYEESGSDASLWTNLYRSIFLTMKALRQCSGRPRVDLFNSLWEDLLTFVYKAMRESSDPAIANRILDQALKLGGGTMHHSRLLERACEFGLLQYVQHNLSILPPLARTQAAEEIFPHALLPNPTSGELSPDLVTYLLSLGVDVNKSTASKTDPKLVQSISTKSPHVEHQPSHNVDPTYSAERSRLKYELDRETLLSTVPDLNAAINTMASPEMLQGTPADDSYSYLHQFYQAMDSSDRQPYFDIVASLPQVTGLADTPELGKPIPVSRSLISSFKAKLYTKQLSLNQKGLSEVVSLLKAKGANLDLPVSTLVQSRKPRRTTIKDFQIGDDSWTERGDVIYDRVDLRNRERKRTYEEEPENGHYPFDSKRSRREGSSRASWPCPG